MNEREEIAIKELKNHAMDLMSRLACFQEQTRNRFVLAYMANGFQNATQAAKEAGFQRKESAGGKTALARSQQVWKSDTYTTSC